ncbi:DUF3131 domain-containing protein [Jiella mangrovi]|uniref:DUF3131 domain-containing protein n=1 Tax=Jiella mangrovi TaxID=2821407 RepID=A0ABS4BIA8_9HYPH|nr:DUF3131 domain-containing protein [Jiella mangrovi]MBP0616488.1 DUF3131 domain-containing protein [Jiella mangrovi]
MSFKENLVRGRSQLIFIAGLLSASVVILAVDDVSESLRAAPAGTPSAQAPAVMAKADSVSEKIAAIEPMKLAALRPLTEKEMTQAKIAWRYFQNNTDKNTLLVNAANNYPSTTIWDTGSYLIGLISAYRLGIIEDVEFHGRLNGALVSLDTMELFEGRLPNKAYDVRTLKMSTYANKPDPRGLGWSALDVAHFLVPMSYIMRNYPEHAKDVRKLLTKWDLAALVQEGDMFGTAVRDDKTVFRQEGRVGYEQYGAKAMMLFGLDAVDAAKAERNLTFQMVGDVAVPVDDRKLGNGSASFATSEPYVLDGLDFGFDSTSLRLASNVYRAQEQRYRDTGQFTAVSEGHISVKPYFTYSTVWGGGDPWAVMRLDGSRMDELRSISTKAAFGWDALFGTDYTKALVASLDDLADPEKGWMEGRFEADGSPNGSLSCNTNAIILASLAYKQFGPLMRHQMGS